MNEVFEQLAADPWGRLVLRHVATGGLSNCYLFLLVAARLAGICIVTPLIQATAIPISARLGFVIALSMIVSPTLSGHVPNDHEITLTAYESSLPFVIPTTAIDLGCIILSELGLGTLLGIGLLVFFGGLRLGGEWLDRHSGLGIGSVMTPDWFAGGTACGSLVQLLSFAAFLLIHPVGGHLLIVQTTLQSFHAIPVGSAAWTMSATELMTGLAQQAFVLGLRIAIPLIAIMTLVDMTLGFAGRGAPAPWSSLGLALRTTVGLVVLALTTTALPEAIATSTILMLQLLNSFD